VFAKETLLWQKNSKKRPSGQVLDHQELRHPPKDYSQRKDRREKRTKSQTTFMDRNVRNWCDIPDAATLLSVQERARFALGMKHMYAYTEYYIEHYKKRNQSVALPGTVLFEQARSETQPPRKELRRSFRKFSFSIGGETKLHSKLSDLTQGLASRARRVSSQC